jgi:hypothetical protein
MNLKPILLGLAIIATSFFASLEVMDYFWPRAIERPALALLPPLPQVARTSEIMAPIKISLATIGTALDRSAPRDLDGKAPNPAAQILQNADINWTVQRGAISTSGVQNALTLSTPLIGKLTVLGSLNAREGSPLGNALGNILGSNAAKKIGDISIKSLNANAAIQGMVTMTSRPEITPNWRIDPKVTAQVNLNNSSLTVAGAKVAVPAQVKPMIDKAVAEQVQVFQQRLRNDPSLEKSMRREWDKMCRSIPLPAAGAGSPALFLEMKPVRAVAAQPQVDASNVTLTIGLQAETRIVAAQTTPNCPFPQTLDIVPPLDTGHIDIGAPIDLPFEEVGRIVEAQLKNRTFPEDGSGAIAVSVKRVNVDAAGDRLLISLLVNAREKKSWFGLGGDATVRIWGRPVLDSGHQILRLADLEVAVDSDAALGLMGAAARAATPYLQKALAERATIDLKSLAANAQQKLSSIITGLRSADDGLRVDAAVTSLRLGGIAFDSKTLRVIAEASGSINVTITSLPNL